jgi:glycosyltransferase involved in cell wall biosynthesis
MGVRESGIKVFGLFVGDVDVVPDSWQQLMNMCDVVMTPSSWCRDVVMSSDVSSRVMVLNHGITDVFVPASDSSEKSGDANDMFVFLHMCSAVFYPERKGTPQFFKAAQRLAKEVDNVIFRVVFGMNTRVIKGLLSELSDETKERVQVYFFSGSRPQSEITKIYNGCHAAVFPSRAEGFGCIPLEVRSCGIPSVQTLCTGHRDHIDPKDDPARWGVVEIPHGQLSRAWGDFGRAPSVNSDDVYEAMKRCIAEYKTLRMAALEMADAVRTQWSWSETTKPLIELLRKECV